MIVASKVAGFFAAHAIWSLSSSDTFGPMLAYVLEDGERKMDRLTGHDVGAAIDAARQRLVSNEMDANDAVLLYDAFIPYKGERKPAVIMEMRTYFAPDAEAKIAVPYTPRETGEFAVHNPAILEWKGCEDFDKKANINSFFEGVQEHKQGATVWRASFVPAK